MRTLLTLARPFVAILAHRAGPECLPASQLLLGLVIVCHISVYMLGMSMVDADPARLLGMPLIDTVAQASIFAVLLAATGFGARTLQTLTAVFGVDALLNSLVVAILLAINMTGESSALGLMLSLTYFAVMLWSLAVKGHILKRAVEFPYFVGVLIALAFAISLLTIDRTLFPGSPG